MKPIIEVLKDTAELKCRTCTCCLKPAVMKIYLGNELNGHKQTQSVVFCEEHAAELKNKI